MANLAAMLLAAKVTPAGVALGITAANTTLDIISRMPAFARAATSGSLIEFTQPTRVEPIVLMDDSVVYLPYTRDLLQVLNNLFAAYYLQAVALLVNVGDINVVDLLDQVNPTRSLSHNVVRGLAATALAMEDIDSYTYGLPEPGGKIGLEHFGMTSVEARGTLDKGANALGADLKDYIGDTHGGLGRDSVKLAMEVNNLATGKLLAVDIQSGEHKASIPVMVRLIVTTAPSDGVKRILKIGYKKLTMKERFHAWRAGQLSFIKDIMFCQDLIDSHKKGLISDKTGFYATSVNRSNINKASTMAGYAAPAIVAGIRKKQHLSGSGASVSNASNIIVISENTKRAFEREIGSKLDNFKTRETIFKTTYSMILVVIDPEWEGVTIYHRSISTPTTLTAKDLKISAGKSTDIGELLKMYQMGQGINI